MAFQIFTGYQVSGDGSPEGQVAGNLYITFGGDGAVLIDSSGVIKETDKRKAGSVCRKSDDIGNGSGGERIDISRSG